ncbi:MAG: Kazal-type serine protease inhibitor family protein [Crocinitomicaceae bacterium]|jgi:hypothetical protein|nr:Kazal-type serine protease inhibitor family protein [Crocinitomicaceae bacterium]MDG1659748.1 Kazal-type serine protease inhibitor family protein [Crocinitomicaceae bacterium]MDG2440913.1 Kazal-type serine protease inhibitor family protein [Crocinitomicaceae bacterium]|tara:strand:- start:101 stop:346 length:246 start_codon:yes stop_codon:yes gene_type:complete
MKVIFGLVLAVVFLGCVKDSTPDCPQTPIAEPCIDTSLIDPTALCADNYDPVCGCDGVTYSNGCAATINGVSSFTKGVCCD